jgi:hypothetical protein
MIEADQRNGCVARSATESSSVRDVFLEMNSKVRLDSDFRAEEFRSTDNQISVIGWNARLIAGKLQSALIEQTDLEAIKHADRNQQRINIVKTVLAPPDDAKRQVDLGRSEELHALAKVRAQHPLPYVHSGRAACRRRLGS